MAARLIDGRIIAAGLKDEIRSEIEKIKAAGGETPVLAVIIVGENPASKVYVRNKRRACEYVGIESRLYELPEETGESELLELIGRLNNMGDVNGILVQLPLPPQINEDVIFAAVSPEKDVDCFNPYNIGLLSMGKPQLPACTPAGIIELLKRTEGLGLTDLSGKKCVVVGRSNIVGKPVAAMLLAENATVTVCHSRTKDLADVTRGADILVAAVGKAEFIKREMIKPGSIVIDVGINRTAGSKKVVGDVDFGGCSEVAEWITPVPGGVGVMTIAMLMMNCLTAYKLQRT